jgi:hypothetical protein
VGGYLYWQLFKGLLGFGATSSGVGADGQIMVVFAYYTYGSDSDGVGELLLS